MSKIKYINVSVILFVLNFSGLGQADNLIDNNYNSFFYPNDSDQWISSQGGWNKYDGKDTKHYLIEDSLSGLKGTWIQSSMIRELNGNLWTSTYEYLCYYDENDDRFNCFHPIINGDTIKQDIRVIHYQAGRNYLIIQAADGLYEYNIDKQIYRSLIHNEKTNSVVFNTYVKGDTVYIYGSSWTINQIFEIWTIKNKEWSKKIIDFSRCNNELKDIQISDAKYIDEDIWLITNLGLVLLNIETPCLSRIFRIINTKHSYVKALEFQNNLLITTDFEGLLIFNPEKEEFIKQIKEGDLLTPLLNNSPVDIAESKEDVFLSFISEGIQKISKSELRSHLLFEGHTQSLKQQRFVLRVNDFLILSDRLEEIFIINSEYEIRDIINLDMSSIMSDIIFKDDSIFYSDDNSIWSYNLKTKSHQKIYNNESKKIHSLEYHDGQLFVVASNKLYKLVEGELNLLFENQKQIDNELIYFKVINDSCVLYAKASEIIINQSGVQKTIKTNSFIYDLAYKWDSNEILLSLGNGLGVVSLSTLNFRNINIHDGRVEQINKFEKGAFILETSKGIFFLDNEYKIRKIYTNNEEVISCALFNNDFIYLTKSGIHSILKTDLFSTKSDSIFISSSSMPLKIKNNEIFLQYDYKENPPEISLATNNIKNNESGVYSYQLDFNNDIGTFDLSEKLSLPILSEGNHTLYIQGYNLDLTESNQIKVYIDISGPWWRQWWFILILIFIVILGAWYFIRLSTKRHEKEFRIKEEIYRLEKSALQAQMNPHFIFNCLNSIQNFIMDNDKENAMDYLGRFAQLIRSNLNASIKEKITLFEEVEILENYLCLEQLRLNNKFSYQIDFPSKLELKEIHLPPMLIQPFIENAVIHGMKNVKRDGNITISISVIESILHVTVKDNGVNDMQTLESNHSHKSVGISITNKRLAFINNAPKNKITTNLDITPNGTFVSINISLEDS